MKKKFDRGGFFEVDCPHKRVGGYIEIQAGNHRRVTDVKRGKKGHKRVVREKKMAVSQNIKKVNDNFFPALPSSYQSVEKYCWTIIYMNRGSRKNILWSVKFSADSQRETRVADIDLK